MKLIVTAMIAALALVLINSSFAIEKSDYLNSHLDTISIDREPPFTH